MSAAPLPRGVARPGAARAVHSRIESVGARLPATRLTTRDLLASCRHRFRVDLEGLTGIRERRVCRDDESSFTLAVDAAWDCLAHSRYDAQDLDMVVSCSITRWQGPDRRFTYEPSLSLSIREAIGATRAVHFDVSNACAGMMTGVHILDSFVRRGVIRRGMVVSGERITGLARNATQTVRGLWSRELASLTVGDAGAAVIVERTEREGAGILASELVSYGAHSGLCTARPNPRGTGGVMHTRPRKLHRVAIESCMPSIRRTLERAGVSLADTVVIPHQTSTRAMRAGTKVLVREFGTEPKRVVSMVEELGNTASTSHFVVLRRCLERGLIDPGEPVLLLCFASGLTIGSMLFTMDELGEAYARAN